MKSSIFNLPAMWNGNDKWWMALIHSSLRDFNYTLRPWQMGTTWEEENWGWVGSSSKYQKFIIPKIGIFLVFWICLLVFWTPLFWYFEHFGILSIFVFWTFLYFEHFFRRMMAIGILIVGWYFDHLLIFWIHNIFLVYTSALPVGTLVTMLPTCFIALPFVKRNYLSRNPKDYLARKQLALSSIVLSYLIPNESKSKKMKGGQHKRFLSHSRGQFFENLLKGRNSVKMSTLPQPVLCAAFSAEG